MRDKIHDAVCSALEKDGWQVVNDPYSLELRDVRIEIDLEIEPVLELERAGHSILVEIKTLQRASIFYSFYAVYGQYKFYQNALRKQGIDKTLYLAISSEAYEKIQAIHDLLEWIEDNKLNLIIINLEQEEVTQWIDY